MANNIDARQDAGNGFSRIRWSSVIIFAGCALLYRETYSIRDLGLDVLGPAFMPRLVLGILMVLCALDIGTVLFLRRASEDASAPEFRVRLQPASLSVIAILAIYVAILATGEVNTELATIAFIIAAGVAAGARGVTSLLWLVGIAIPFAFLICWLFRAILYVALP